MRIAKRLLTALLLMLAAAYTLRNIAVWYGVRQEESADARFNQRIVKATNRLSQAQTASRKLQLIAQLRHDLDPNRLCLKMIPQPTQRTLRQAGETVGRLLEDLDPSVRDVAMGMLVKCRLATYGKARAIRFLDLPVRQIPPMDHHVPPLVRRQSTRQAGIGGAHGSSAGRREALSVHFRTGRCAQTPRLHRLRGCHAIRYRSSGFIGWVADRGHRVSWRRWWSRLRPATGRALPVAA